jgi:hypothetical protein
MWLRSLLTDLGFESTRPITLYDDNQVSRTIAHNPIAHAHSREIAIRYHFVRELVERRVILIDYVKTTSMLADGLTKPLPPNSFARFVDTLWSSLGRE